jgi:hypothetical protein
MERRIGKTEQIPAWCSNKFFNDNINIPICKFS